MISERMKKNNYYNPYSKSYFWRTVSQQEIDYIEENNNEIMAIEFKWNEKKKEKKISSFTNSYQKEIKTITPSNFREFLDYSIPITTPVFRNETP